MGPASVAVRVCKGIVEERKVVGVHNDGGRLGMYLTY